MGYLPEIYKDFNQQFPDIARAYAALADTCHHWGPLDKKTRRLIKLGIAIGLSSDGGVRSHARRALEEGVTPDELRHAVLLSFTTAGFPTMIASMKWVEEVIQKTGGPCLSLCLFSEDRFVRCGFGDGWFSPAR